MISLRDIELENCLFFCTCSKSKRIHFFLWSWVFLASSPPITFARLSQQVIRVPMEGSLFLVVQLRKFSLHWYFPFLFSLFDVILILTHIMIFGFHRISLSSLQRRNLLQGISMTLSGSSGIFFEVVLD